MTAKAAAGRDGRDRDTQKFVDTAVEIGDRHNRLDTLDYVVAEGEEKGNEDREIWIPRSCRRVISEMTNLVGETPRWVDPLSGRSFVADARFGAKRNKSFSA